MNKYIINVLTREFEWKFILLVASSANTTVRTVRDNAETAARALSPTSAAAAAAPLSDEDHLEMAMAGSEFDYKSKAKATPRVGLFKFLMKLNY